MKNKKAYGYSKYDAREIMSRKEETEDYKKDVLSVNAFHNAGAKTHKHPNEAHRPRFSDEEQLICNDNRTNRLLMSKQQGRSG